MGASVNTAGDDFAPYVTVDNKYLFYESGYSSPSSIYWVKVDELIDSLRYTNFVPYLNYQIPAQSFQAGQLCGYTVPDSTFIDDDGNYTLTYSATLSNGNPLPAWLSFDPATRTFEGTPTEAININVKVKAVDSANVSVTCTFAISVIITGIDENKEQLPESINLYQNYPNPFNPTTTIKFSLPKSDQVSLKIYDVLGKEIKNIFSGHLNAGDYSFDFDAENISSGIYFYVMKTNTFCDQKKMTVLK